MKSNQKGSSLLIVLVLLTVLLMAAATLAKGNQTSNLVAGNMSYKAAAMQASEAGLAEAFAQLQLLAPTAVDTVQTDVSNHKWYFPTVSSLDKPGLPTGKDAAGTSTGGLDFTSAPSVAVAGGYTASYVVERMCTSVPANPNEYATKCFVKRLAAAGSSKAGTEMMDAPSVTQYRMTVYVQGPKGTQTFVQAMATRSS